MLDRRNFLRTMISGVAAGAAVRTWPFRVFSFPADIRRPTIDEVLISQQQNFRIDFDPTIGDFIVDSEWDQYDVAYQRAIYPDVVKRQTLFGRGSERHR